MRREDKAKNSREEGMRLRRDMVREKKEAGKRVSRG